MIKRLAILLAVWFTAACPGHAKAAPCDILGLKTGMDASEVLSIVYARFVGVRKPFIRKAPSDLLGQPYTAEIAMGDDHESIHIDFVVRVPIDKARPEAAYLIRYELKNPSQADIQQFRQRAEAKYGPLPASGYSSTIKGCAGLEISPPALLDLTDAAWVDNKNRAEKELSHGRVHF